ncbi:MULTISPECIES: hypothetical protein [Sphingobium]|uniref:hypothetical protein n=1 Tax=Sphingobium TaxID=165695 RepID=UPI00159C052A|nr:hypothetical protein [Sphingobium sp. 15-1]
MLIVLSALMACSFYGKLRNGRRNGKVRRTLRMSQRRCIGLENRSEEEIEALRADEQCAVDRNAIASSGAKSR